MRSALFVELTPAEYEMEPLATAGFPRHRVIPGSVPADAGRDCLDAPTTPFGLMFSTGLPEDAIVDATGVALDPESQVATYPESQVATISPQAGAPTTCVSILRTDRGDWDADPDKD